MKISLDTLSRKTSRVGFRGKDESKSPLSFSLKRGALQSFTVKKGEEWIELVGLKPAVQAELMKRFKENGGAVVIEDLVPGVVKKGKNYRQLVLGLAHQAAANPVIIDACGLDTAEPFNVRVVSDTSRSKRQVGHVDEPHFDCGPQDSAGCSSNKDTHVILIADGPYKGVLPGQKTRMLASSEAYKKALVELPTVYPRVNALHGELALYESFQPHKGMLFLTSNVDVPDKKIHRWAHIIKPDGHQPIWTLNPLNLSPEFVAACMRYGYTNKEVEGFKLKIEEEKTRLIKAWEKTRGQMERKLKRSLETRINSLKTGLDALKGDVDKLITAVQTTSRRSRNFKRGEYRQFKNLTPDSTAYQSRLRTKLTRFLKEQMGIKGNTTLPYALCQLTKGNGGRISGPSDCQNFLRSGQNSS